MDEKKTKKKKNRMNVTRPQSVKNLAWTFEAVCNDLRELEEFECVRHKKVSA